MITLLETEYFPLIDRGDKVVSSSIITITVFITCDDNIQTSQQIVFQSIADCDARRRRWWEGLCCLMFG